MFEPERPDLRKHGVYTEVKYYVDGIPFDTKEAAEFEAAKYNLRLYLIDQDWSPAESAEFLHSFSSHETVDLLEEYCMAYRSNETLQEIKKSNRAALNKDPINPTYSPEEAELFRIQPIDKGQAFGG